MLFDFCQIRTSRVLHLNETVNSGGETVQDILISKHPMGQPADPGALLQEHDYDATSISPIPTIFRLRVLMLLPFAKNLWSSRSLRYGCMRLEKTLHFLSV